MPSVAAPRGSGNNKRPPLRDRKNEERFEEEDSEGEVAWRNPAGGRAPSRDMRQLRPYYFLVRKSFVSIAEGKESPSSQIRRLYSELQCVIGDAEKEDLFFQEVRHFSMYSILVPQREPVVEKTIKFIAGLCTYPAGIKDRERKEKENNEKEGDETPESPQKMENPLLTRMLSFALDNHDAADKTVRFRLCQIVNLCLENLGEEAELDDDLYDRLLENLLKRMKDKSPTVRQHACLALHRLQDPTDKECQVVNIFKFLMACDPVAEVRRQIVSLIALTSHTLPELIKRTRDGNELVRKTAYIALTEKVGLKGFSIQRRISLLKNGFQENPRVKAVVQNKLLMGWLRVSQNNKVKFLKYLDVEEEPKLMENILLFIFKMSQSDEEIEELIQEFRSIYLDDDCLVPLDKLDTETAFYWRHLCCYLRRGGGGGAEKPAEKTCATSSGSATSLASSNADNELVDIRGKLVPASPLKYMEYLVAYLDKMKTKENLESDEDLEEAMTIDFTCEQLLEMISVYDWSLFPNERKSMDEFLRKRLISDKTPLPVLPALLKQWRTLINPGTEIQLVAEFLAEIQAPMSTDEVMESANQFIESMTEAKAEVAMAHIRVVEVEDAIEAAVAARDFNRAAQLQEQLLPVQKEHAEKKKKYEEACEDKESLVPNKEKVVSEVEEQKILLHCLTILVDTLEKTRESISTKEHLSPILLELVPGLILTGVTCHSPSVRVVAIKCLGLVSLFSKFKAQEHWDLFFQATLLDTPLVKIVALQAIFDCLLVYGIGAFNDANPREEDEESPAATPQRRDEDESTEDESESGVGEDGEEEEEQEKEEEEDPFQEAYELNSTGSKKTVGDKSRFIRRRKSTKKRKSGEASAASTATAGNETASAESPRESEEMSKSMMTILVGYLDFDSVNIQEVTLLGFAKLLLHDRIVSGRLLSRMLLLWFNPTAVDFQRYLAIFLEKYASKSQEHQEAILESFVPTLNQILKAPETSPLSEISFDKVCSLVARLTAGQTLSENHGKASSAIESPVHENMALLVVNEILKNPSGVLMRPYLSTLNQLQLSTKNLTFLENLDVLARQLVDIPKDSFSKRIARKFQATVDQLLTTAKEAAEGPALDDSLVDGTAEDNEEPASGEVNMSERSVGGAPAKTAPSTPTAPSGETLTTTTPTTPTTTDRKSPLDEDDVEEADLEEDEQSSDEDENEQTASATSRVRRDLRAKRSLGEIVADIEDNNSGVDTRNAVGAASTSTLASDQTEENPSSESDAESRASTTASKSSSKASAKSSSKTSSKAGSKTRARALRSSSGAAASKHKHSPSTPGSTDQESESSTASTSKNKKPAKKKRRKKAI